MFVKILRIALLIMLPIEVVINTYWFMKHEPFEEIVRTGLAIIIAAILSVGWITTLKDFLE